MVKTRVIKLRGIGGPNALTTLAFGAFHSFLVEVQTKLATYMRCMRNNNLEIRTAGASCRPQRNTLKCGKRDCLLFWLCFSGYLHSTVFVTFWYHINSDLYVIRQTGKYNLWLTNTIHLCTWQEGVFQRPWEGSMSNSLQRNRKLFKSFIYLFIYTYLILDRWIKTVPQ